MGEIRDDEVDRADRTAETRAEARAADTTTEDRTNVPAPADDAKDTAKVRIRRVAGAEPITGLSYVRFRTPELDSQPHSNALGQWHPDPAEDEFEVSADIATAAVETGGFEVDSSSRVKLKTGAGQSSEGGE